MKRIKANSVEDIIYKRMVKEAQFFHLREINDLAAFKQEADVDIVNWRLSDLEDVAEKNDTQYPFAYD